MATGRVADLLRSRSDFTDEEILQMTEHEAWAWIHGHRTPPGPEQGDFGHRDDLDLNPA